MEYPCKDCKYLSNCYFGMPTIENNCRKLEYDTEWVVHHCKDCKYLSNCYFGMPTIENNCRKLEYDTEWVEHHKNLLMI